MRATRQRPAATDARAGSGAPRGLAAHLAAPLFRNAYFLILGAGSGAVLGFVFWGLAARRFSTHNVGVNSALIAAMMVVSGVCQLGLNAVLFRYLPRAGASTRRVILKTYALTVGLSVLAALAAALTSTWWAPSLDFLANDGWWLAAFVVATAAWTVFSLQDNVVAGLRQTHWVAIEDTSFAAAKVVLLVALAGAAPKPGIFLAWNIPVLASLLPVNLLIFWRLIPRHLEQTASERSWDTRRIIRFAGGNYVGQLFLLASTTLLPILVAAESGAVETAYFFVPWAIAAGVQVIAVNMTTSLTVEVAFDESKLREYSRRVAFHTMRIVAPLALVLFVGATAALRFFGPGYAHGGGTLLRLLALALIPNVIVAIGLSVARIQHDGRLVILIQGALCVPIVGLSLLLLPRLGIEGVGVAYLVGQTAVASWLVLGRLRPLLLPEAAHAAGQGGLPHTSDEPSDAEEHGAVGANDPLPADSR